MPALSFPIQALISRLVRVRFPPWFILQDVGQLPSREAVTFDENGDIRVRGFKDKVFRHLKSPTPAEATASPNSIDNPIWPFLHLDYLRYLQQRQPPRSVIETYGSSYQDYLQIPLQPLTHNLESMTYEVFEKDPVKYELYEEAIRKALRDWKDKKFPTSGRDDRVVVAVAGAGRGPLISRALKASKEENVPIEMWAVEKNPNAFVFLQRRNRDEWQNAVTLEKCDMRAWKGPWHLQPQSNGLEASLSSDTDQDDAETDVTAKKIYHPVDILISELLGSFADNELSPECLDGILHLLAPTGISIPRSYTAFMTPIAAPKLHADILARTSWDSTAPETPSVVLLHAIDYLTSTDTSPSKGASPLRSTVIDSPVTPRVLEAWSFEHRPLSRKQEIPVSNEHNERFVTLRFGILHRATCHGLGGYFESVLYPGVELSTHPNTMEAKSSSMISWFPIFFPLKVRG
jgi:type II protein arginine methyltransferase